MVELYSRRRDYTGSDGTAKTTTDFFLKCGNENIPIVVKYFEGKDGRDPQFGGRCRVLNAFASELPAKAEEGKEVK